MIEGLIVTLQEFAVQYGILGLLAAALLEEIIAPIPSAVVMMSSGFLLMQDAAISPQSVAKLLFAISLPLAVGVTIGSLLVYALAYYAGKPMLDRFGKYLGVSWRDVERVEKYFKGHYTDEIFLFAFRAVPVIPNVAINAVAGLVQWNIKTYLVITFLGTWLRAVAAVFLGWQLGNLYEEYAAQIEQVENLVLYTVAAVGILFVTYRIWKKNRKGKASR